MQPFNAHEKYIYDKVLLSLTHCQSYVTNAMYVFHIHHEYLIITFEEGTSRYPRYAYVLLTYIMYVTDIGNERYLDTQLYIDDIEF